MRSLFYYLVFVYALFHTPVLWGIFVYSASTQMEMFEKTIKNCTVDLDALNERRTFSSGDLMTGHVSFELTKETTITSITMEVTGRLHVHWTSGTKHRKVHSERRDFFKLNSVIAPENSGMTSQTQQLPPGTHVYPFTSQLPQGDFPTSFRGVHGETEYTVKVDINRSWNRSKDFVTEFNFVNHVDINQSEVSAPLSGSNTMTVCCLWCASGPITVTGSVEKKAFTPGETAKIICDFSNASSRRATPTVKLQQKQSYYSSTSEGRRIYFKTLNSSTGQPISAHTTDVHTEFTLTIPSTASLTISNCDILQVEYFIEVSLKVARSSEVAVMIPIILCETSVDPQPPQYSSVIA